MKAQFKVGDIVNAIALPDAFPEARPAVIGLTVTQVRLINPASGNFPMQPYYRVKAYKPDGIAYVEGAESCFELANSCTDPNCDLCKLDCWSA